MCRLRSPCFDTTLPSANNMKFITPRATRLFLYIRGHGQIVGPAVGHLVPCIIVYKYMDYSPDVDSEGCIPLSTIGERRRAGCYTSLHSPMDRETSDSHPCGGSAAATSPMPLTRVEAWLVAANGGPSAKQGIPPRSVTQQPDPRSPPCGSTPAIRYPIHGDLGV